MRSAASSRQPLGGRDPRLRRRRPARAAEPRLMVIDTSAVVSILFDEPERRALTEAVEADPVRLISAATLLESALVVEARRGEVAGRELDLLMHRADVRTVPMDEHHVQIARKAWRRYGKGRDPAALNFGD